MYKCYFCQFTWSEKYKYGDKSVRPEGERDGHICPRCMLIQGDISDENIWRMAFRKFVYGSNLTREEMLRFEDFLMKNFTPNDPNP